MLFRSSKQKEYARQGLYNYEKVWADGRKLIPAGGIVRVVMPLHASALTLAELDFHSLAEVKDRLLRFQDHYGAVARPLQWKFSREDCRTLLAKIHTHQQTFRKAA